MIGIFGGTFDPIHFGHLRIALEVAEGLALDQVRFIPLNIAVHREQPGTPKELRLKMVQAAIADQPKFVADARELKRDQPSYTLETLQSLRSELGEQIPLCFLLGGDAFKGFLSWHKPLQILELCHLVVMQRPGTPSIAESSELAALVAAQKTERSAELKTHPAGKIYFQSVTQIDISSTDIRHRLSSGLSLQYLTPDSVIQWLLNHRNQITPASEN